MSFEEKYNSYKKPVVVPTNYERQLQAKLEVRLAKKSKPIWAWVSTSFAAAAVLVLVLMVWKPWATEDVLLAKENITMKQEAGTNIALTIDQTDSNWLASNLLSAQEIASVPSLESTVFEDPNFSNEYIYEYLLDEDFLEY